MFIGGTACDILMNRVGADFHATKDVDMVLIAETLDANFGSRFWEYIIAGGYEHRRKNTGVPQYYRFTEPTSSEYPAMIELLSRRLDSMALPSKIELTPLPIDDDVPSLSAILLDDEYYAFLKSGIDTTFGRFRLSLQFCNAVLFQWLLLIRVPATYTHLLLLRTLDIPLNTIWVMKPPSMYRF